MAESADGGQIAPRGALYGYAERLSSLGHGIPVEVGAPARTFDLRVDPTTSALLAVEDVLGLPLPAASRFASGDGRTVVWLGPDEWLVIDPAMSPSLEQSLRDAVGSHGAVVEQSGQRLSLVVSGDAAGLLAKGTGLDLRGDGFGPGVALQGLLAQAVVVFLARSENARTVELLVRTSFARYVADWLRDAASDPLAYPAQAEG